MREIFPFGVNRYPFNRTPSWAVKFGIAVAQVVHTTGRYGRIVSIGMLAFRTGLYVG